MAPADCETLLHAAPMHDIGKVGVPDSILHKPGPLDDVERDRMRLHTTVGAEILSGSRSPIVQMAEEIALTHHERWDGSGYPRGLRGTEIPLVGRICAVGDVFDALISARSYKRAWSIDDALVELQRQAGELLDPELVEALVSVRDDLPGLIEPGGRRVRDALGAAQQHGFALAAAAAHRGDAECGAVAAHLVGEGEEEAEAGGGERVAERDRAAVDVDPAGVDLQRAGGRHGDAGERLVDLPQVDVFRLQPFACEQLLRRFRRAEVQRGVRAGDDGSPDHLGERLVARFLCSLRGGQDSGGAAVRELGGVARRDRPLAREGGR